MNVQTIKLLSGEDIICEVGTGTNEDDVLVINPLQIGVTEQGVGLAPWMILSQSKSFIIKRCLVMAMGEPIDELTAKYTEIVGGIVLPTKSKILTANNIH